MSTFLKAFWYTEIYRPGVFRKRTTFENKHLVKSLLPDFTFDICASVSAGV